MFLPQLIVLYVLLKQWSSVGAKHSNTAGSRLHASHVLFHTEGLLCREISLGGYHAASQLKQKCLFHLC